MLYRSEFLWNYLKNCINNNGLIFEFNTSINPTQEFVINSISTADNNIYTSDSVDQRALYIYSNSDKIVITWKLKDDQIIINYQNGQIKKLFKLTEYESIFDYNIDDSMLMEALVKTVYRDRVIPLLQPYKDAIIIISLIAIEYKEMAPNRMSSKNKLINGFLNDDDDI